MPPNNRIEEAFLYELWYLARLGVFADSWESTRIRLKQRGYIQGNSTSPQSEGNRYRSSQPSDYTNSSGRTQNDGSSSYNSGHGGRYRNDYTSNRSSWQDHIRGNSNTSRDHDSRYTGPFGHDHGEGHVSKPAYSGTKGSTPGGSRRAPGSDRNYGAQVPRGGQRRGYSQNDDSSRYPRPSGPGKARSGGYKFHRGYSGGGGGVGDKNSDHIYDDNSFDGAVASYVGGFVNGCVKCNDDGHETDVMGWVDDYTDGLIDGWEYNCSKDFDEDSDDDPGDEYEEEEDGDDDYDCDDDYDVDYDDDYFDDGGDQFDFGFD